MRRAYSRTSVALLLGAAGLSVGCKILLEDDEPDTGDSSGLNAGRGPGGEGSRRLPASITADTTLESGSYLVSGTASVRGARLTIQPGVTLTFETGAALEVLQDASLVAVGTGQLPIVFEGFIAEPGSWRSLDILSNDTANEIGFVQFMHGGGDDRCCAAGREATMVLVGEEGRVAIHDSSFALSEHNGLEVESGATLPRFANNSFRAVQGAPVRIAARLVGSLDSASDYLGDAATPHGDPFIEVAGTNVPADTTWPKTNLPLLSRDGLRVVESVLTLAPGAHLEFAPGTGLEIPVDSSLSALGTASERILLSGASADPGSWVGVLVQSNSALNQLAFVDIVGGGEDDFCCSAGRVAAGLVAEGDAHIGIEDSSFRDSGSYGLQVTGAVVLQPYARNSFSGNEAAPVLIAASALHQLDSASTYVGQNENDRLDVRGGTVTADGTWPALDAPYHVIDADILVAGAISIAPGAHLSFEAERGLWVEANGSLNAASTSADILFDGAIDQAGYWKGLAFASNDPANLLDGVTVDGAGSDDWCCAAGRQPTAVLVEPSSQVTVRNSTLSRSGGWAVLARDGYVSLVESGNSFSTNASGDVSLPAE